MQCVPPEESEEDYDAGEVRTERNVFAFFVCFKGLIMLLEQRGHVDYYDNKGRDFNKHH